MKLSVRERIILSNILPKEGSFVTLTIKNDLLSKTNITQEEIKELDMKFDDNGIVWNIQKEKEKDFEFTELEERLIKTELKELDKRDALNEDTFNLYKLFIHE